MPINRIIVIGASAGGVGALCSLVEGLPANLPAAIFIVQHLGPSSILDKVLLRCNPKSGVVIPKNAEKIEPGHIYLAVPDHHLAIEDSRVYLRKSPRENFHRPSVDVLFRSAARAYGPRVIGVILTGSMDDGASGMFAVKSKGGIGIVHDPKEAMVPDMPLSAMAATEIDYCLPLAKIPPLLVSLSNQPVPNGVAMEHDKHKSEINQNEPEDNEHPRFVCPECDGPLIQFEDGRMVRFRCKIGHQFSLDSLTEAHAEALERGLWIAVRTLEDRAAIQRLRGERFKAAGDQESRAASALEIASQAEKDAQLLRAIMEKL
jgi:two-component system, chemotaxis family, protein-glutamate methylesterase/glutaminase